MDDFVATINWPAVIAIAALIGACVGFWTQVYRPWKSDHDELVKWQQVMDHWREDFERWNDRQDTTLKALDKRVSRLFDDVHETNLTLTRIMTRLEYIAPSARH